ncbi:putative oxidoreductase C19A8.06 [Psilocybe cubensis]|uniref:Oxidoreductase C19A8.06 n=1 Tax=Psilocybe cubensis TaxID=181762 RepID=A0ACB8HF57_PSICU|nr:putative oxidoreductase C19A8.06 [Psilocybe cubensis]KAH9486292.1 putative oxidoreductase C19A8.06 [Psilocybe cubensis]
MVLGVLEALVYTYFPTQYTVHIAIGIVSILALRVFSQGRRTTRERDLHNRTILLTGGFTPLGLTLIQSLAQRGAHIIALSPDPIDSENITILVDLLRTTTSNEEIYADECDLTSPASIRAFCTKFLTEKEQRLDAIIFAHEHKHIGVPSIFSRSSKEQDQKARDANSLATFLITTLLLPALLVAPPERDIRIINVVNPFYAAAAGLPFSPSFVIPGSEEPSTSKSIFLEEGRRSLRSVVFTRHLQRILDALPTAAQVPKTEEGSTSVPVVSPKIQKSNIVAISASPGIGRVDTVSNFLNADLLSPTGSYFGLFLYLVLQPILRIVTKSPTLAMQSILHVLFLPTPFKILSVAANTANSKVATQGPLDTSLPEEVLLPGALYANCAAVKLNVKVPEELVERDREAKAGEKRKTGKGKSKATEEILDIADDGEYGGELAGRLVWEEYEGALKVWESQNPGDVEKEKKKYASSTAKAPPKVSPMTDAAEDPNVY